MSGVRNRLERFAKMTNETKPTDPRVGKLTPEGAANLKEAVIAAGCYDAIPSWMRDEIEAKTQPTELPSVGGRRLDCSNNEFERRCLCALKREQEKVAPDNAIVAVLCDAVRCVREYGDNMKLAIKSRADIDAGMGREKK